MPHNIKERNSVIYLVEERLNPSTDYFVLPAVSRMGRQVVRCGFNDVPSAADLSGATVVFVRYIPKGWAKVIENARDRLCRLMCSICNQRKDYR